MLLHWSTSLTELAAVPCIASFVGTVIDRGALGKSIGLGRSRCDCCQKVLPMPDLIPVASFIVLQGHCRFCTAAIPTRYFLAETSALLLSAASLAVIGGVNFLVSLPLASLLFALAYFDFRRGRLPDALTLPLCALGLTIAPFKTGAFVDHLIGAGLAFTVAASIAKVYHALRNRDGLGGGDIKLLAAAGAWVGSDSVFVVLLLSCAAALPYALVTGRISKSSPLPFGPFIAATTWATWCWQISSDGARL